MLRDHVFKVHQTLEQERGAAPNANNDEDVDDKNFQISHIMEDY